MSKQKPTVFWNAGVGAGPTSPPPYAMHRRVLTSSRRVPGEASSEEFKPHYKECGGEGKKVMVTLTTQHSTSPHALWKHAWKWAFKPILAQMEGDPQGLRAPCSSLWTAPWVLCPSEPLRHCFCLLSPLEPHKLNAVGSREKAEILSPTKRDTES